jgi:hypothetical protein
LAAALAATVWACGAGAAGAAVAFHLTADATMDAQALAAFQMAADRWSGILGNPITVNINVAFGPLGDMILGSTNTVKQLGTYTDVRARLAAQATSAYDVQAVSALPAGAAFAMLINRTDENPNGSGSMTPYLDDNGSLNNKWIRMTTGNAKALGLRGAGDTRTDATITFSSSFAWDFDPSDGISPDARDFVGAATHEIGHALGFVSGVDTLDAGGLFSEDFYTYVSPIDLFRYSAESAAQGVIDWTADKRLKYFSLDVGATDLGGFATGAKYGDGRNASHWREAIAPDLPLGLMDPTLAKGELMQIGSLDREAFDVIGYDVVPEPVSAVVLLMGWGLLRRVRRG